MNAQLGRDAWEPAQPLLRRGGVKPLTMALDHILGELGDRLGARRSPTTAAELAQLKRQVRGALLESLGLYPSPERTPLNPRVVGRTERDGYAIERVIFESRPHFFVPANVYVPSGIRGRVPAVVCPTGHWMATGKEDPTHVQPRCIGLARRGYMVLTYDPIGQGERRTPGNHHSLGYTSFMLGSCNMGWMVWDSMRAIDYLLTRPEVDGERIGITGASGGGANSFYTAAVDERVRAAVPVVFVCTYLEWFRYGGNNCICDHLPGFQGRFEEFDVACLIAPRALLILNSYSDAGYPVSGARVTFEAAKQIYGLAGAPRHVNYLELPTRHGYLAPEREAMYGWFDLHLRGRGDGGPQKEAPGETEPVGSPALRCFQADFPAKQKTMIDFNREAYEAVRSRAPLVPGAALRGRLAAALGGFPQKTPLYERDVTRKDATPAAPRAVVFRSGTGIALPAFLMRSAAANPKAVVIYLHPEGKHTVFGHPLSAKLLDAGMHILALDLRGMGETGRYAGQPGYPDEFQCCTDSVGLGRPVLGRRVWDLLCALDYLEKTSPEPGLPVFVYGEGVSGNIALFAAAHDSRIRAVAVSGALLSYRPAVQEIYDQTRVSNSETCTLITAEARVHYSLFLPGILKIADLPEIYSTIAPRGIFAANPALPEDLSEIRRKLPGILIRERLAEPELSSEVCRWFEAVSSALKG